MKQTESRYDRQISSLFEGGREKVYPKNQLIHYQGDPLSQIYMVKSGFVKAYTILDSGDTRTILLLGRGDIFPLSFAETLDWSEYKIRYFYQSLTEVELIVLPSDQLEQRLKDNPENTATYMNYLAASNEVVMNQLEVMKNKKAIDKVAMLLPYLISKSGKRIRPDVYELELKLSHQEVADLSGVTRETTTTLIKELEKEKVIEQKHGSWIINTKHLEKFIHAE